MHLDAVALAADELVGPTGIVGQGPVVGGRVGGVQRGQAGGDLDGGAAGGDEADFADAKGTDGSPGVAGDHARDAQGADFGSVQAVAGVYACSGEGNGGGRVGGVESPVCRAAVARREFAVGRDEGAGVHQQVVVFTEAKVGSRVDGDGVRAVVNGDQGAVSRDDDVGGGGVVVDQGDVFTGDGLDVLVKAQNQIGPAGDGAGGFAVDAQGRGVKVQGKGAAGRVALQLGGVFYDGLEAVVGFAGAQAGGREAPGAGASDGGRAQASAVDGVVHGNALARFKGAAVSTADGGRGVVAGGARAQCASGVAKVVCDAGDAGRCLGHVGHSLQRGQRVDGAAVVGGAHQGFDDARKVGVGHAGHAQQLQLGFGHERGGARCGV